MDGDVLMFSWRIEEDREVFKVGEVFTVIFMFYNCSEDRKVRLKVIEGGLIYGLKFRTDGRVMGRDIVLDYVLRLGEMVEWRVEFNAVRSVRVNYSPRVIFEVDGRRMGKCLSRCLL